jgi:hypothetical protein
MRGFNILDQLLSLDVGQAVHAGDTITVTVLVSKSALHAMSSQSSKSRRAFVWTSFVSSAAGLPNSLLQVCSDGVCTVWGNVPDGEDAAGLSEVDLLLDTTDPLLEDGRHLGRRGPGFGVGAGLEGGDGGCGISLSRDLSAKPKIPMSSQKPRKKWHNSDPGPGARPIPRSKAQSSSIERRGGVQGGLGSGASTRAMEWRW